MALTKISRGLLNTGISDSSDATAITIDSSENVGIGTSSPDSKLHVDSGVSSTSDWGNLGIISDFPINNTGRIYTSYVLQDSESIKAAGIGLAYDGTGYKMHFGTASTTSSGLSTAATIDRAGNVGINYTTPSSMNAAANNLVVGSGTSSDNTGLTIFSNSDASGSLHFADGTSGAEAYAGYIYYTHSSNFMGFGTGATEAMRIDSSGNVGIGTTSPSSYYSKELVVAASDNGGITIVNSDTSHAAYLMFADGTSGADAYRGQIGYDHNNNSMFFSTDSTLRLMIDSSGKVFIGLSAQINSSMLSVGDGGVGITYSGAPANYYRQIYQSSSGNLFFYNGSNQGYIDQAGAFNDASDERIKKDIEDISYGLDTVKALKPRKYKMKLNDDEQIGFIAQEVESLVPEIVNTGETPDGEEQKGMSYGHLTAVLTKAIQEQQTLIETLQAKVEALENG
jgi:hypothetical protein